MDKNYQETILSYYHFWENFRFIFKQILTAISVQLMNFIFKNMCHIEKRILPKLFRYLISSHVKCGQKTKMRSQKYCEKLGEKI